MVKYNDALNVIQKCIGQINNCPHNTQNLNLLEDDAGNCEEVNIVLSNKDVDKNDIFGAKT